MTNRPETGSGCVYGGLRRHPETLKSLSFRAAGFGMPWLSLWACIVAEGPCTRKVREYFPHEDSAA